MNEKQKLAAMGEHMAEQAAQPLCMAKRIEELESQVRVMAVLLRDARKYVTALGKPDDEVSAVQMTVSRIDAALAGKLPAPAAPQGWQMVPVEATMAMISAATAATTGFGTRAQWDAMLAAAPSPDSDK